MSYSKGLHILAEIDTNQIEMLQDYKPVKNLLNHLIQKHKLSIIGEVFHNFEGGGYTGVFCLTESHISIHTWSEYGRVTYDVFLSNYRNNNESIVRDIHEQLLVFFKPIEVNLTEIYR